MLFFHWHITTLLKIRLQIPNHRFQVRLLLTFPDMANPFPSPVLRCWCCSSGFFYCLNLTRWLSCHGQDSSHLPLMEQLGEEATSEPGLPGGGCGVGVPKFSCGNLTWQWKLPVIVLLSHFLNHRDLPIPMFAWKPKGILEPSFFAGAIGNICFKKSGWIPFLQTSDACPLGASWKQVVPGVPSKPHSACYP